MLTKVILLSDCTFKELSPIVGNFSYEYLVPFVRIATDIDISEIIGEKMLKKLEAGVATEPDSLNSQEQLLLIDYIQPALVHLAMARAYTNLLFKPDSSGIVKRDSENGTSADMNEASFLQDQEKVIGQSYSKRLKDYLEANRELYPEYNTEVPGEIKPSDTPSFNGGLWLGISNNNCNTN